MKSKIRNNWSFPAKGRAGYSLIELLIYLVLLSFIILFSTRLFFEIKSLKAETEVSTTLQRNARFVFEEMTQAVRAATEISVPLPGETGDILVLNNGQIKYQLNEAVLQKEESGEIFSVTTSEVTVQEVSFEHIASPEQRPTIKIKIKLVSNYLLEGERRSSAQFQTTISLR